MNKTTPSCISKLYTLAPIDVTVYCVRCTWCQLLYRAIPNQLGHFSEYGTFMCLPCITKYEYGLGGE